VVHESPASPHISRQSQSEFGFRQMPFRGAGSVAPASRRQFCAAAGAQKIAGGTPALPNPNLDDETRDHRTDPSNRREKLRLDFSRTNPHLSVLHAQTRFNSGQRPGFAGL